MIGWTYVKNMIDLFDISGNVIDIIPWGNGHMNETFRVKTDTGEEYLFQRINRSAYDDIPGMMENIYTVTEMIRKQTFYLRDGKKKKTLYLIPLKAGGYYYMDPDGFGWRAYNFMKDSYSMESIDNGLDALKIGMILGQFHYLLRDFPVEKMHVVTPDFHNPAKYYEKLLKAVKEDRVGRLKEVGAELAYLQENSSKFDYFERAHQSGRIPLRVNHNDPKVNNIMMDRANLEPICMVDLDTLMPGYVPFDFGDAIRSCMCTGKDREDMTDFSGITCNMEYYDNYYKGFLDGIQGILTPEEIEDLPKGAKLIVLESAIRYLTDYLNGDTYYKVNYPTQNLIKARMHIQLERDMENKL